MASLPTLPPEARRILKLARSDRRAARGAMAALPLDAQVALVCETPLERRAELLDLAPEPERLVPALPEAELCYTAKALGLHDAELVLAHATAEQLVACLDLDAWRGDVPDRGSLEAWVRALAEAGEEPLLRFAHAADAELLALLLADRIEVFPKESGDDWEPPVGAKTLDGQFFFRARRGADDLAEIETLLDALFRQDYWRYFRLLQAVLWDVGADTEEWALRWRSGRLQDLGFPHWEEAMRIYGRIRAEHLADLPEQDRYRDIGEWSLPVWMPGIPATAEAGPLLFRTLAALPDEERRPHLYAFVALANAVAVADRMPLGDAETIPRALAKAAEVASAGLEFLARERGEEATALLRRASLERLFRVGVSLGAGRPPARVEPPEADAAGEGAEPE